jgi:hypothetical protein
VEQLASIDNLVRPITRYAAFETTITASEVGLSGFVVRFGTFKRRNVATLELSLKRTRTRETKSATVETEALVDNAFVAFRFAAFDNAAGETFTFSIRSTAAPDRCVAVFVTPGGDLETRLLYGDFLLDCTRVLVPPDLMVQTIDTRASRAGSTETLTYALTHWWVDRFGVYLDGSLTFPSAAIARVRLSVGDALGDLSFETIDDHPACRFFGYLACRPGEAIWLLADTDLGPASTRVVLPYEPLIQPPSPDLFLKFIALVNREKDSVLEVGSRKSSPYSVSNRAHFASHVRFVGFDILPGANTDVVGDAHELTGYFPERSLGAAYSLAVLEHLVMPWRFAVELNRVLELGALVYHATHQTWPPHAQPNDFYRYSDEALKFLFGADAGFEVIDSHMEHRLWMYPEERASHVYLKTPLFPGYGNSQVLARKVRHIDRTGAAWDVEAARLIERSRAYPRFPSE